MNTDIRLSTGFFTHPKTRKLEKQLGVEGVRSLLVLWLWVAQNKPDGCLKGMDWEYIELAADWRGEERAFFDHCLGAWIDEVEGEYFIHGWKEHNPWAAEADDRSAKARFSRLAKVNRPEYDRLCAAGVNAISREEYEQLTSVKHPPCEPITASNETSTERQPNVNGALTPVPAPSPSPAPNALKDTPLTPQGGSRAAREEYSDDFEHFWREYPNQKSGKKKAYSAFRGALRKTTLAEILKSLAAYKKSEQWTKNNGKFIPYATTWLNGELWTVEVETQLSDGRFIDEDGIVWSGSKYVCKN